MKSFNLKDVQRINEWLQNLNVQQIANDPHTLHEIALMCATYKAFTAEAMSIAKKEWHDKKVKEYNSFVLSNEANGSKVEKYGAMVVKDYIASKCGGLDAQYLYCERTNNAVGETADIIRTVISSLKSLMNV